MLRVFEPCYIKQTGWSILNAIPYRGRCPNAIKNFLSGPVSVQRQRERTFGRRQTVRLLFRTRQFVLEIYGYKVIIIRHEPGCAVANGVMVECGSVELLP